MQNTLRVAYGTFDKHNKKTRSREPLGNSGVSTYVLVKAVGKTKEQRADSRDAAREGWAKTSAECNELRLQASEAARLAKLVARLQKELAGKIDVTEQRVLEAQVLEADRKLRASVRQQEDADARSRPVVEQFRRQCAAAEADRQTFDRERAQFTEREKATKKSLQKAASLCSSASVVDAELRTAQAAAELERLQRSVASLQAQRSMHESAAQSESARAAVAELEAAAIREWPTCTDAEMTSLQRDLSHAFFAMHAAQQDTEVEKASAVAAAQRAAEFTAELTAAQKISTLK
eukprot:460872-Pleurochrysis_carterae.AAC.1